MVVVVLLVLVMVVRSLVSGDDVQKRARIRRQT